MHSLLYVKLIADSQTGGKGSCCLIMNSIFSSFHDCTVYCTSHIPVFLVALLASHRTSSGKSAVIDMQYLYNYCTTEALQIKASACSVFPRRLLLARLRLPSSVQCYRAKDWIISKIAFRRITSEWSVEKSSNLAGTYLHPFWTLPENYGKFVVNHKYVWFFELFCSVKTLWLLSGEFLGVKVLNVNQQRYT